MYLTKAILIVLPSGKEYCYDSSKPDSDIRNILLHPSHITINFKNRGPMTWISSNLAGFSHDKDMVNLAAEVTVAEGELREERTIPTPSPQNLQ